MKPLAELANFLPHLAIIAAVFGFIGWSLHKLIARPTAEKSSSAKPTATADKGRLERVKNLEASLEKSKAAQKALKTEVEELREKSVPIADFESTVAELDATRKSLETESKRFSTLETDLKKSQETIKHLNARANEADKAQKDRSFGLENELSKVREQLAVFQNTPDDTKNLQTEIERLRESVAVSSRYAGEMRKREATALEALEKAEAKLADLSDPSRPAAAVSKKVGPVMDSGRIAAAKAEVIRLVEMNKQKEALVDTDLVEEVPAAIIEETPAAIEEVAVAMIEETPAAIEEVPTAVIEETSAAIEEIPVLADEAPVAKKAAPATELFALD